MLPSKEKMKRFRGVVLSLALTFCMLFCGATGVAAQEVISEQEYAEYQEFLVAKKLSEKREAWMQRSPYELAVGFDLLPITLLTDVFSTFSGEQITRRMPMMNVGFTYKHNKLLTFGVLTTYTKRKYDYYTEPDFSNLEFDYSSFVRAYSHSSAYHLFSIAPRLRVDWFRRRFITLYSSLAVGVMAEVDHNKTTGKKITDVYPYYELTYLGAKFGGRVYAFVDISSSMVGFCRAGMGYNF